MSSLAVGSSAAATAQSFSLPQGTLSYDGEPYFAVAGGVLRTLFICAAIIWAAYLLKGPLERYIDRITEAETPLGKLKTPLPPQETVKNPNVSQPPTSDGAEQPEGAAQPEVSQSQPSTRSELDECRSALEKAQVEARGWAYSWELERTYNIIFGSQLNLLRELEAGPLTITQASQRMTAAQENAKTPIPTFLSFLINGGLVATEKDSSGTGILELTKKGHDLLAYVRSQDLPLSKPGW